MAESILYDITAIRWYVKHIAPLLAQRMPDAKLHCVGNYWLKFAAKFPESRKYINYTGYLSDSVRRKNTQ